ncbi:MAG: N-acetylmuramoyl-L-alanine amidase [Fimbriimonadaceae bacterium]
MGLALLGLTQAVTQPVQVQFAHHPPTSAVRADGNSVWADVSVLQQWDIPSQIRDRRVDLQFNRMAIGVPIRQHQGRWQFKFDQFAESIDSVQRWEGDLLVVSAKVTGIRIIDSEIRVGTTFPVQFSETTEGNKRFLLISGAQLPPRVPLVLETGMSAENRGATVRIDLGECQLDRKGPVVSHYFSALIVKPGAGAPTVRPAPPQTATAPTPAPTQPTQAPPRTSPRTDDPLPVPTSQQGSARATPQAQLQPQAQPVSQPVRRTSNASEPIGPPLPRIQNILMNEGSDRVRARFNSEPLITPARSERASATEMTVTFDLVDTATAPRSWRAPNGLVSATSEVSGNRITYRFVMNRPLGVDLSLNAAEPSVLFIVPNVGDGRLAGKVIAIDAGHGGRDPGAIHRPSGVQEKDIVLSVSRMLAEELTKEGATVVMTRNSDIFIPLTERPAIAERAGANLFISVHVNATSRATGPSGSITFFHRNERVSEALATAIQQEKSKATPIPSMGVWSDSRITQVGFAVLRHSKTPAVLLELGFINNDHDRRILVQPDMQRRIARGVVNGLKLYYGER